MIELYGFVFITLLGTLFHYIYALTNKNKYAAYFFAVNESTWEHIKLAIGPSYIWLFIEIPFLIENNNFFFAKFTSVTTMIILIPLLFYISKLITKRNISIINISIFIISIYIGMYISNMILSSKDIPNYLNYISAIGLSLIFIFYLIFTYTPLHNFLFIDPITQKYGLEKKD